MLDSLVLHIFCFMDFDTRSHIGILENYNKMEIRILKISKISDLAKSIASSRIAIHSKANDYLAIILIEKTIWASNFEDFWKFQEKYLYHQ